MQGESRLVEWGGRGRKVPLSFAVQSQSIIRIQDGFVSEIAPVSTQYQKKVFSQPYDRIIYCMQTVPTPMVSAASTPIAAIEVAPRAAAPFPMASAPPGSPPPDFSDLVIFEPGFWSTERGFSDCCSADFGPCLPANQL